MIVVLVILLATARLAQNAGRTMRTGSWVPVALGVAGISIAVGAAVYIARRRAAEAMEARSALVELMGPRSRWPALDAAREGYHALTGQMAPEVGVKSREFTAERIDAEYVLMSRTVGSNGERLVVDPFKADADAAPVLAFNEAMLDVYTSAELLAVMLHLMYRGELLRGPSATVANGVCEADSKTLLMQRDHVALLGAIEKTTPRTTPHPGTGVVRFADEDLRAKDFTPGGEVRAWTTRDRVAELRMHLGALGLDAQPEL